MKYRFLILLSLIFLQNAFSYDFSCIPKENARILTSTNKRKAEETNLFSNRIVVLSTDEVLNKTDDYFLIKDSNPRTYLNINDVILFDNNLVKSFFNAPNLILESCLVSMYKNNMNLVFPYAGDVKKFVSENQDVLDFPDTPWEKYCGPIVLEHNNNEFYTVIKEMNVSPFTGISFDLIEIDKTNVTFYISHIDNPYNFGVINKIVFNELEIGSVYKFSYKIDGDYLYFYRDGKLFFSFVSIADNSVFDELLKEYKKFITGQVFTFPDLKNCAYHADGTRDYGGSKKTVAIQSANVAKNKTMTVNENLKLRSGEATSTQVLTVMSAGTKVKILELGKDETIDGINSNWVKVEVQTATKDRDGKPIKAGTVGWCYGGYLE